MFLKDLTVFIFYFFFIFNYFLGVKIGKIYIDEIYDSK